MQRILMRAKLHRLTVTEANINYEGSITIDKKLLQAVDVMQGEKVTVVNLNSAARFETYAMEGKVGEVCLNGGAARLGTPGDKIIVICYGMFNEQEAKGFKPKIVLVGDNNLIKKG